MPQETRTQNPSETKAPFVEPTGESAQRLLALAHGFEFAKRCAGASDLEQLHLLLTNDLGALVEYDRAFLVSHLEGATAIVAVSNSPGIAEKTRFHEKALALGQHLRSLDRGMLIPGKVDSTTLTQQGLTEVTVTGLRTYLAFSECDHLFVLPLASGSGPMYHLVVEFFGGKSVSETRLLVLLSAAPLLASAIAQKWILHRRPDVRALLDPEFEKLAREASAGRRKGWVALALALILGILVLVPIPLSVGGEAEVSSRSRHMAFCQIAGLVDQVMVKEGTRVEAGQLLATLDPREIDHRMKSAGRQIEIYSNEIAFLERAAAQGEVAKLAEKGLVDLRRKQVEAEFKHLQWQKGFLEIRAPVGGIVVTRDVDSLAGKKLMAGEPLCELLGSGELAVDLFLPENRVSRARIGQTLELYLDSDPRVGFRLQIEEIAPRADAIPRLGNVFRVRATFANAPDHVLPGMKGIGRVAVGSGSLGSQILDRILVTWRKFSLSFG